MGRKLAEQCAPTLKRVSMELGGAAPLIVFADADLDLAVAETIKGKFRNSGQTCVCPNRVYVQRSVAETYAEKLAAEVSKIKVPVAMIWGDRDDVTPLAQANDLRALIPQASLKVMQDVGHIPQIEDPAAFNAALIDAIRQLASADPAVAHAGRN